MNETTHSGEHPKDVTINESSKIDVKFALIVGGLLVGGLTSFLALQAQVNAQDTRINGLERVMCAVAKKLDVLVAECQRGD